MRYGEEDFLRCVENAMGMPDINSLISNWCVSGYDVDVQIMNTDNTPGFNTAKISFNGEDDNSKIISDFCILDSVKKICREINAQIAKNNMSGIWEWDKARFKKYPVPQILYKNDGYETVISSTNNNYMRISKYKIWGGKLLLLTDGIDQETTERISSIQEINIEDIKKILLIHWSRGRILLPIGQSVETNASYKKQVELLDNNSGISVESQILRMSISAYTLAELYLGLKVFQHEKIPADVTVEKTPFGKIFYRLWANCQVQKMCQVERLYMTLRGGSA